MRDTAIVAPTKGASGVLRPVGVADVALTDSFWQPRREINRTKTILSQWAHCESTGRIDNFRRASGRKAGIDFVGIFFNDSDIYKWLEAASWSLASHPDSELEKLVDSVIDDVGAAQQPDGYLNTYFMFERAKDRFSNLKDMHEMYCAGHLFQASVAHFRATGKRSLLEVACRLADCLDNRFGDSDGKIPGACGHPEAEMGLVELGRATGERRYIELAAHMVSARGRTPAVCGGGPYWQDHVPFGALDEAIGHAVRMLYLSAGATDVLAENAAGANDSAWRDAIFAQWENFTNRRMYITGGAGARWEGEAFGRDFELPNDRAYAETCAAIAGVMWAHRLTLLTGESRFADYAERALFNAILPGLSLSGDHYFYQNPLADNGKHRRQEWFGCACCPPNVARLLAQLPGYFYATGDNDTVYVLQYASGTANIELSDGTIANVKQTANYPWGDTITITVSGAARVALRIPDWADGASVSVKDGETVSATPGTFHFVELPDGGESTIFLVLPMEPKLWAAHPHATMLENQAAITRGPIVYAIESADNPDMKIIEWVDNPNSSLADIATRADIRLDAFFREDLLGGVVTLEGVGFVAAPASESLYRPLETSAREEWSTMDIIAIPYYAWANREPGAMRVWIPLADRK